MSDNIEEQPESHVLDPSVQANTTAYRIQRALKWMIWATVVLYLGLFVLAYWGYTISRTNTRALCAVRADSERRVNDSVVFLKENPNGIPGISVEQLKRSTDNATRTMKALSNLDCDPVPLLPPK